MISLIRHTVARESVKFLLGRMLRWEQLGNPEAGFSIVLGVPWDLRHLLPVNLKFVARTDLSELRRIHVVFDRPPREGAESLIESAKREFSKLPLAFRFHDRMSGRIVNRVHVSTFYNSMNTVLGIADCTTRYVVLHDFDLYPLVPHYFTAICEAMRERGLRFCGLERTYFDGLTDEDNLLGTWALGIDAQWLRANHRPVECFHRMAHIRGRWVNLDPYSYVQTKTPARGMVGTIDGAACCHVKNLCSTYLRFLKGVHPNVVWRLHYLWYLEHLCEHDENFAAAAIAMRTARSSKLIVHKCEVDFGNVHVTCANVLRTELGRMEHALWGRLRPEVDAYIEAFEDFLGVFGDCTPLATGDSEKPAVAGTL